MNASTVVDIKQLQKTYREGWFFGKSFRALNGVTLQVHAGEVFGLLGPNGAGKTTMIKILLGILHPTSGSATVLGEAAGSKGARSRIGYLPENVMFPRHHTGQGALYFYARLNRVPESEIRRREPELMELVGLKGREKEPVRKYSKGMRQRLGLAQAMVHDPDIMIMDEPTDGLDPVGRSQIRSVIEELSRRGKTIFLNSHILQEVEMICNRVAILAKGQLRGLGTTEELTSQFRKTMVTKATIELEGDSETIQSAITSLGATPLDTLPSQRANTSHRSIVLEVPDQSALDRAIDQIRSQQLSICSIHPNRPSLEDVFMQAVESAAPILDQPTNAPQGHS